MKAALALAILAVAAPALGRDRPIPEATADGAPVDCVWSTNIQQTHVRSDSIIDFEMRGGKTYRVTLDQSCPQLGFEERFAYKTYTSQLCSTDIITVLTSPGLSQGASCGLGKFQPVKLTKAAR